MSILDAGNGRATAAYVAAATERILPREVEEAARLCLADWLAVAIGAGEEAAGRIVRGSPRHGAAPGVRRCCSAARRLRRSPPWPTARSRTASISTTPMSRRSAI